MFQETQQGAVTVVRGDGPLTSEHVQEAMAALDKCFDGGVPMAVLDLERVPLLDSAGLELLLNAVEKFDQHGGALKIGGAKRLCLEALAVTGVADRLEVYDKVTDAVRSFLR